MNTNPHTQFVCLAYIGVLTAEHVTIRVPLIIQRALLLHQTLKIPRQTQPTCVGAPTECLNCSNGVAMKLTMKLQKGKNGEWHREKLDILTIQTVKTSSSVHLYTTAAITNKKSNAKIILLPNSVCWAFGYCKTQLTLQLPKIILIIQKLNLMCWRPTA